MCEHLWQLKPLAIINRFFLEMFKSFSPGFMIGNFNPKLSRGFEAHNSDSNSPNGVLHAFSLTKLLPLSIVIRTCLLEACGCNMVLSCFPWK